MGALEVTSFGAMLALAFLFSGTTLALGLGRKGRDPALGWELLAWSVAAGMVGARLYYLLLHWGTTAPDPSSPFFGGPGLVWYGGFIAGVTAFVWTASRRGLPLPLAADAAAPALALGYAIGRVGCFLVGDDWGGPTDGWWGVKFPDPAAVPSTAGNLRAFGVAIPGTVSDSAVMAVHPTQLYEAAGALALFVYLRWTEWQSGGRLRPARLTALFLVWFGLQRVVVEALRAKDDRLLGPLTLAQLISLAVVGAGVWLWLRAPGDGATATAAYPDARRGARRR